MHNTSTPLYIRAKSIGAGFWITNLIILLCFFGIYYQVPLYGDDLFFYKDYITIGQSDRITLEANLKLWQYLWHTDPCRMYNMLLIAQHNIVFNRAFGALALSVIATAFTAIVALSAIRTTGRRNLATPILAFTWALLIYRLPWYDLLNATMTYGYILSTLLAIIFVWFITNSASKRFSILQTIATALFAFICGWMHEGIAIPIGTGLLAWAAVVRKFKLPTHIWIAAICFAGGLALDLLSPLIAARLATDSTPVQFNPIQFIRTFHLTILTVGICGIMALFKQTRSKLTAFAKQPAIFTLAVACLISIAMWTKLPPYNPGVTFLPHTLTILFLICTLAVLYPTGRHETRHKTLTSVITFAILAFNVGAFAKEAYTAHHDRQEFYEIFEDLTHGKTGTVFRDVTSTGRPGFWSMAPRNLWRNKIHVFAMNQHEKRPVNVVPEALRDFAPENARAIAGDAALLDYKGIIVAPDEPLIFKLKEVPFEVPMDEATYVIGERTSAESSTPCQESEILMSRFKFTDSHGKRWLYLQPATPITADKIAYAK